MLICMLFRSYLSIIGGCCFLYLFVSQKRYWSYSSLQLLAAKLRIIYDICKHFVKKSNFFASFLQLSCIINKKRVSLQQV